MKCKNCGIGEVYTISAKCTDDDIRIYKGNNLCSFDEVKNIIEGEYIEFDVCLNCGHIKGKWPIKHNIQTFSSIEKKETKHCCLCKKKLANKSLSSFCPKCLDELNFKEKIIVRL